MSIRLSILSLGLLLASARAALFTDPTQLKKTTYDFVIVGAGAAGGVLANRLSEDFDVLVIEAGVTNAGVTDAIIPFLAPMLQPSTSVTWNYTTTPQAGLDNRTIAYPRGRIMGGSTSINFMVWNRGSRDDYDRYARVTGDAGWSWDALQPYIARIEKLVPSADGHNTEDQVDAKIHSTTGNLPISLPGFPLELDSRVIATTQQLSAEFPFNLDMNSGNTIGVGWTQSSIGNSRRSSSATEYIEPALTRSNLDVLLQSQVTRVIQTGTVKGLPAFNKVEFATSATSKRFTVTAKKEVILSAGSLGTPQILLLSGIGDPAALKAKGITPIVDLPDVGQNLQDHPLLASQWAVTSNKTFDNLRNASVAADDFAEWNTTGQGLFVDGPGNQLAWLRLLNNDTIFKQFADPSAGPTSAHYEMIFSDGFVSFVESTPATGSFMTIVTNVISPAARGSVTLANNDSFTNPIIDPGLLNSPFDMHVMVTALRGALKFLTAPAWAGFVLAPQGALATATTDAELAAYARSLTSSVWHPFGTAAMSPAGAKTGVTDPDLRVKNVSGLRIVDASIFPFVPAGHTQAPVYIIAERAADIIKAAWA